MGLLPKVAAFAVLTLCSGVARAQDPPPRPIALPSNAPFTHEHSKIALPPTLGGLPRTEALENEPHQLHTSFKYISPQSGDAYIVIIYRDVGGGLPVWFDRARGRMERGEIGSATLFGAGPFVPPGRANASGLLATYVLTGKGYRSGGVALVPSGEWLITLLAASSSRSPADLEGRIKSALAEIAWPKTNEAPVAVPVEACASTLAFSGDAKPLRRDQSSVAVTAMAAILRVKLLQLIERAQPPRWCRDSSELGSAGVYRADEQEDGYFIAINDSGRGLRVGRNTVTLTSEGKDASNDQPERFDVQLTQMSNLSVSGLLDRLPPPAQAMTILKERRFAVTVGTWGEIEGQTLLHGNSR